MPSVEETVMDLQNISVHLLVTKYKTTRCHSPKTQYEYEIYVGSWNYDFYQKWNKMNWGNLNHNIVTTKKCGNYSNCIIYMPFSKYLKFILESNSKNEYHLLQICCLRLSSVTPFAPQSPPHLQCLTIALFGIWTKCTINAKTIYTHGKHRKLIKARKHIFQVYFIKMCSVIPFISLSILILFWSSWAILTEHDIQSLFPTMIKVS